MKIVSWNLNGLQACLKNQCFEPVGRNSTRHTVPSGDPNTRGA